jgi:hypothetical protein
MVDGGDFLLWQRDLGASGSPADGDGSGMVDGADLTIWKNNYGAVKAAGGEDYAELNPSQADGEWNDLSDLELRSTFILEWKPILAGAVPGPSSLVVAMAVWLGLARFWGKTVQ